MSFCFGLQQIRRVHSTPRYPRGHVVHRELRNLRQISGREHTMLGLRPTGIK